MHRREIPLLLWVAGEDHPKACTGRRLLRRGLVEPLGPRRSVHRLVLLDPHSTTPLTPLDRRRALEGGLLAVDCSWNLLDARGEYPLSRLHSVGVGQRRRLPWLLAGNPQHFGRVGQLNTAEAVAASLLILGEPGRARQILEGASEGTSFLDVNRPYFEGYTLAESLEGMFRLERRFFGAGDP